MLRFLHVCDLLLIEICLILADCLCLPCAAAVNYPIRLLSRQVNPFTAEILAYINGAPEKIIVLIDLDEHMACNAGNSFYEKQVDNVFIVSGGVFARFAEECQHALSIS